MPIYAHSVEHDQKIPSLVFFHIPLREFGVMWDNLQNHEVVGGKHECVCSGPFNPQLGGFVGHDHASDYAGNNFGIYFVSVSLL